MENRTFTITYDPELFSSNNNVNVHIGATSLTVQFTQLELGVTSHQNGDESSRVFLPNYNDVSLSNINDVSGNPEISSPPPPSSPADLLDIPPPLQRQRRYAEQWDMPPISFVPPLGPRNIMDVSGFWDQQEDFPPISVNENEVFSGDSNQENYEQFIENISVENMGDQTEEERLDNQCSICLNQMTEETRWTTNCQHSFHRQCLDIWENNHSSCPLCRTNLHNHQRRNAVILNGNILPPLEEEEPANGQDLLDFDETAAIIRQGLEPASEIIQRFLDNEADVANNDGTETDEESNGVDTGEFED